MQKFNDPASWWVYGWSQQVIGHKEAEITEVKPSQNIPSHSKTVLKPYKIDNNQLSQLAITAKKQAKQ